MDKNNANIFYKMHYSMLLYELQYVYMHMYILHTPAHKKYRKIIFKIPLSTNLLYIPILNLFFRTLIIFAMSKVFCALLFVLLCLHERKTCYHSKCFGWQIAALKCPTIKTNGCCCCCSDFHILFNVESTWTIESMLKWLFPMTS